MKKLLAIAFVGVLAAGCSKKENTYQQDSNVMLEEPKVQVTADSATAKPADQATVAKDSATVVAKDSATVK